MCSLRALYGTTAKRHTDLEKGRDEPVRCAGGASDGTRDALPAHPTMPCDRTAATTTAWGRGARKSVHQVSSDQRNRDRAARTRLSERVVGVARPEIDDAPADRNVNEVHRLRNGAEKGQRCYWRQAYESDRQRGQRNPAASRNLLSTSASLMAVCSKPNAPETAAVDTRTYSLGSVPRLAHTDVLSSPNKEPVDGKGCAWDVAWLRQEPYARAPGSSGTSASQGASSSSLV